MQKWRKVVLITSILLMILGGFFGFLLGKSGIGGKNIIGNLNVFECLMILLLIITIFFEAHDFYKIFIGKKQLCKVRFNIFIKEKKLLTGAFII